MDLEASDGTFLSPFCLDYFHACHFDSVASTMDDRRPESKPSNLALHTTFVAPPSSCGPKDPGWAFCMTVDCMICQATASLYHSFKGFGS